MAQSRETYERLWRKRSGLQDILNRWDPIGIEPGVEGAPLDEYDCLVPIIIGVLSSDASQRDMRKAINDDLHHHFGLNHSKIVDRTLSDIAEWAAAGE